MEKIKQVGEESFSQIKENISINSIRLPEVIMTTLTLATLAVKGLSAANVQLFLAALLAVSEVLGADPRIKANGLVSFILIQVQNFLKSKETK